jgi:exopolysaccharide biosynthesis protein
MRKGILKCLSLLLAAGLLLVSASAESLEDFHDEAPLLDLPEASRGRFAELTPTEDPQVGPSNGSYLFKKGKDNPYGYADPSITVNIGTGRIYKTNYMYARIRIANPAQLRMMTAEEDLSSKKTVKGSLLAKRMKAVIAINGVLWADVTSDSDWAKVDGPVLVQQSWRRPGAKTSASKVERWKEEEAMDTLAIDSNGDFHILSGATWGDIMEELEAMGDEAVNAFTFGPALIVDGEPQYGYDNRQMSSHRPAQRAAICQTGPLEYLLITSEGPDDPPVDKQGLKLDQFVELISTRFPDVRTAYNLDGGSTSTLVFRKGSDRWEKINCPKSKRERGLRDLIYFADAWIPKK